MGVYIGFMGLLLKRLEPGIMCGLHTEISSEKNIYSLSEGLCRCTKFYPTESTLWNFPGLDYDNCVCTYAQLESLLA